MDLFPDGLHVRLRSSAREGMYMHANEDGWGVYLSSKRASLHAAWRVHRITRAGEDFVLLYNAAYGRYLGVLPEPASGGHIGRRVVQGVYSGENANLLTWSPARVDVTIYDEVVLRHYINDRLLRANGKILGWHDGVSADDDADSQSTMTRWVVEAIPPKVLATPDLPPPTPDEHPRRCFLDRFLCSASVPGVLERTIRFVRAADDGSFEPNETRVLEFQGRSVFQLRAAMAEELEEGSVHDIKLCVRPGNRARLTPLVIDLPRNEFSMDFVVLTAGTPAAELPEPDVDAVADA